MNLKNTMFRKWLRFLFVSFLVSFGFHYIFKSCQIEIVRPCLGIPAIISENAQFEILLKQSTPLMQPKLQIDLVNKDRISPISVVFRKNSGSQTELTVTPGYLPEPGLYDLKIISENSQLYQPCAVYVPDVIPEPFIFLHLSDLHFGLSSQTDELIRRVIAEINLIHPACVLISGDLVHGKSKNEHEIFQDFLKTITVPVICCPGNHDQRFWFEYLKFFKLPYHRVDYGNFSILSLNSSHGKDQLTHSQFHWLKKELSTMKNRSVIVQLHHPVIGEHGICQSSEKLVATLNKDYIKVVLSGHLHIDTQLEIPVQMNVPRNKTRYISTTSCGGINREIRRGTTSYAGYRLIRISKEESVEYNYDHDGDGLSNNNQSIPCGNLSVEITSNESLMVTNYLFETFKNVHVDSGSVLDSDEFARFKESLPLNIQWPLIFDLPARTAINVTFNSNGIPIFEKQKIDVSIQTNETHLHYEDL